MLRVRVLTPTDPPVLHEAMEPGPVCFGRDASNDLILDATYISRSHGEFSFEQGYWWVSAWGSRTPIERQRGSQREELPHRTPVPLKHGDVLHLLHTRLEVTFVDASSRAYGDDTEDPTEFRSIAPLAVATTVDSRSDTSDTLLRASESAARAVLMLGFEQHAAVVAHCLRTGALAASFGVLLAELDRLRLDAASLGALRLAGWLHDVGKLASSSLADAGAEVRSHPERSADFAARLALPDSLSMLPTWILRHHERLDGSGYPARDAGDPLDVWMRLLQVVDIFDSAAGEHTDATAAAGWIRDHAGCCGDLGRAGLDIDAGLAALRRHAAVGRIDPDLVDPWAERRPWTSPCAIHGASCTAAVTGP